MKRNLFVVMRAHFTQPFHQVSFVKKRANEVWGKVMFLHICHSVHGGGGCLWSLYDVTSCLAAWSHVAFQGGLCLWSHVPSGKSPSRGSLSGCGGLPDRNASLDTPPPPDRDPPYGKERAVHILLECILVVNGCSL